MLGVPLPTFTTQPSIPSIAGGGISYVPASMTFTGGLITDAVREAGLQGDGLTPPAGVGIWPGATNLIENGGFETNTTGWEGTGASIARITSDALFGSACLEVTVSSAADLAGARLSSGVVVSAGAAYTGSLWMKASAGTPTVAISLVEYTAGDVFVQTNTQASGVVLSTDEWTRVRLSITTQGTTGIIRVYAATFGSQTATFKVDGVQLETGLIATPYIETDGGTASRSAGGIAFTPTDLITPTQFWIAYRIRSGWDADADVAFGGAPPHLLRWRTDGSNEIFLEYDATNDRWRIVRTGSGTSAQEATASLTFNAGDTYTVIVKGNATTVGISYNGGTFTYANQSAIPSLPTTAYLLSWGATRQLMGEGLWLAMGSGTLTDADAAALNAFGDTPPTMSQLVSKLLPAAQVKAVWPAVDATFFKRAA